MDIVVELIPLGNRESPQARILEELAIILVSFLGFEGNAAPKPESAHVNKGLKYGVL